MQCAQRRRSVSHSIAASDLRLVAPCAQVMCIYDGWRGIDTQIVHDGLQTFKHTDENSCPDGTDIWVPRTKALLDAVVAYYGEDAHFVVRDRRDLLTVTDLAFALYDARMNEQNPHTHMVKAIITITMVLMMNRIALEWSSR